MRKTKLPSALVYGWDKFGEFSILSTLSEHEGLVEDVVIFSCEDHSNFYVDFSKYQPDVIITFGDKNQYEFILEASNENLVNTKWTHLDEILSDEELANKVDELSTYWSCGSNQNVFGSKNLPFFSAFTGTYKTGDRIFRTYNGLKNQTYKNWEWVVVDDSPEDDFDTWNKLQEIASNDHRVKIHRITPNTGGNVGEVKHRAAMLCNGDWLLEYDHDDVIASTYFEECVKASKQYPDAGFIFTGCAELYEDGKHKQYGPIDPTGYGRYGFNNYTWAYSWHEWVVIDGKKYIGGFAPSINPKTIRYNMGMPNHARMWHRDVYHKVRGHNRYISVADDFELIVKTFLTTRMLKIDKILYMQWNNYSSTVDMNLTDINRRARIIRNYYDKAIHERILELGKEDWDWDEETQKCHHAWWIDRSRYFEKEQVLNYTIK